MPCASNTLMYKEEEVTTRNSRKGKNGYYEVVLPTVRQVAKNQFNCPTLEGARLENQPTSMEDCTGSHWDERSWFTEVMSPIYDKKGAYFSPLTLALLEDTGWYKSNFNVAENSPFGLGAGCDFVNSDCIVDDAVPDYGRGFFCDDKTDAVHCGPSHQYKTVCDLFYTNPDRPYFSDKRLGPKFNFADFCPMNTSPSSAVTYCDDTGTAKMFNVEEFGPASQCLDVVVGSSESAMCLQSSCNAEKHIFEFVVDGSTYACEEDFQVVNVIPSGGSSFRVNCPRLAQMCPDMFCPGMCSGKGTCDWSLPKPSCRCFDETDTTEGCYESAVNEAGVCVPPSLGFRMKLSIVTLAIPLLVAISQLL